jgi:GDP/UDP-N,N'-diacetylbacillosamine 2-epimerase (hydrolysing)
MDRVIAEDSLEFELYVTGMHLSPEFGNTVTLIEDDGIPVAERIEILLSSDTPSAITKSMGLAMIGFGDVLARRKPDVLVILGDRFEALCAAAAATVARVPIAHIHGGELTQGAIDDAFRHAITKMSYLHFTSTEEHRRRVIRLGEAPDRVFNVGAIGIENIKNLNLLDKHDLERELKVKLKEQIALVTFHPTTLASEPTAVQMRQLLEALDRTPEIFIIFTKTNADTDGRVINRMIDEYVVSHPSRAIAFTSMGQLCYLSAMSLASVVIGNSSSGIIEAPSFEIPTVNIGERQKGRTRAASVIDCNSDIESVTSAIIKALTLSYSDSLKGVKNPYYQPETSLNIFKQICIFLNFGMKNKLFYEGGA